MNNIWKIWVDTGGTFTDCFGIDLNEKLHRVKILSSGKLIGLIESNNGSSLKVQVNWPVKADIFRGYKLTVYLHPKKSFRVKSSDLINGMINIDENPGNLENVGFEICSEEEAPIVAARLVTRSSLDQHLPALEMRLGSTKGTNALLEGKGSQVIFMTTRGHGEMLNIGTQQRPNLFALNIEKAPSLFEKALEIDERVLSNGMVEKPLDENRIRKILENESNLRNHCFAVCLLNAYQNPEHEEKIRKLLQSLGIKHISLSHELVNEIGVLTRAQTTVVNGYLSEIVENYLRSVKSKLKQGNLKVMTSAGGLVDADLFKPKDSLMSGPAGGVVGCANVAKTHGLMKILSFDMGGTSTDVSRYDRGYDYKFFTEINNTIINSPTLAIETVAAGGGSICSFDGYKLSVGPESAGAFPGPVCYGNNGPLTITDVNLLLGRIADGNFSIPLNLKASKEAFKELKSKMSNDIGDEEVLHGFLKIANEKMAEAIQKISIGKGYNPSDYALLAFGGAGGQHACSVADLLKIGKVVIPYDAGLLSAFGMGQAEIERFVTRQILKTLEQAESRFESLFSEMLEDARDQLSNEGIPEDKIYIRNKYVYLRYQGQENTLEVTYGDEPLVESFRKLYKKIYGHWIEGGIIEVESLKLIVACKETNLVLNEYENDGQSARPENYVSCFSGREWLETPVYIWENMPVESNIIGPALLLSDNSTVYLEQGWSLKIARQRDAILSRIEKSKKQSVAMIESAELELFTNRFKSIADDMGAILQRTSFSVNVKDRLDFSCAVLDSNGFLVANAPHIPVHLGSLGVCVRTVAKEIEMENGDVIITNHPGYGGSHLPDITLIAPVYFDGQLIGYVANRAHHAELGGKTPGSMPADATCLGEEGVVIPPMFIVKNHRPLWAEIESLLKKDPYPSRSVKENLADLNGALASVQTGMDGLKLLCDNHGADQVIKYTQKLINYSGASLLRTFQKLKNSQWQAQELLDDGNRIKVQITKKEEEILFDFNGSSQVHPGNLNANLAILNSAVIYVLRLMIEEPLPLNEGLMKYVKISVPNCMLNPSFDKDPMKSPAVVGGNTETSQRIVDTLIKALKLAACSQGTMNNLIFGNDRFGFYETIGGGVGAGDGFDGANAVHQHMTNTRITDPEILEFRYPVVLEKMSIRKASGGKGKWCGGDGIVRQLRFEEDVTLTMLSQHRVQSPFGMDGGLSGKTGKQVVFSKSGEEIELKGIETIELKKGDRIRIETPGGGGYGSITVD